VCFRQLDPASCSGGQHILRPGRLRNIEAEYRGDDVFVFLADCQRRIRQTFQNHQALA